MATNKANLAVHNPYSKPYRPSSGPKVTVYCASCGELLRFDPESPRRGWPLHDAPFTYACPECASRRDLEDLRKDKEIWDAQEMTLGYIYLGWPGGELPEAIRAALKSGGRSYE